MTGTQSKTQREVDTNLLAQKIKGWAIQLGFDEAGITDTSLVQHEGHLEAWLKRGMHGEMDYMQRHGIKRTRPEELVAGTLRVISVRMDYAPEDIKDAARVLEASNIGYVSRYALGRDYHKLIRNRLKQLAQKIENEIGELGYRVFTDSAPVMEKALAEKSGLGWIGKHTNLLNSKTGSWFFLGEIYVNIELPIDSPASNHCGSCTNCIDLCPTQAIVGPYQVDARRCISYLTIELKNAIPLEFRSMIGNRIYGCDDCQLVCPWNKFAKISKEKDFSPRSAVTDRQLIDLLKWTQADFLKKTEGSAIRRIGYQSWVRNVAVGLGNAEPCGEIISAIRKKLEDPDVEAMAKEHLSWALNKQQKQIEHP